MPAHDARTHPPASCFAQKQVEYHGKVAPAFITVDMGNVCHPDAIWLLHIKLGSANEFTLLMKVDLRVVICA